ncbi:MAG TPA: hypothetical protein VL337_00965 [Acidimicrobiales bacterium]|nr:hypothetical protein [Acidimicrobiales bacterium]
MTMLLDGHGAPAAGRSTSRRNFAVLVLIAVSVVVVGVMVTVSPSAGRVAVAACVAVFLAVFCLSFPRASIVGLVVWLTALGMVRRLFLSLGASGDFDPLLLVAPAAVALLLAVAARQGAFRQRTPLTAGVLILSGLVVLSTVNPLQGGLAVGIGALLFVLVPVLWFWIGRGLLTDALVGRVLVVTAISSLAAAGYGLFQVYRGFPAWDQRWIDAKGYAALVVGNSIRPFASFSNASEYVTFLAIGAVIWALLIRRHRPVLSATVALAIISWSLAVASVRSIAVLLLVTLALVWAMSHGLSGAQSTVIGLIGLLAFGAAIATVNPARVGGSKTSNLLGRQVTGLADPFNSDERVSTLPVHLRLIWDGLRSAVHNPVGQGFGSVTIAGERLGGATASTEADPSNVAVALGIPGLAAYVWVVVFGLRLAFRRARAERSFRTLAALGILLVTFLQWLTGGNYATAIFPWLLLGWLDRPSPRPRRAEQATGPTAALAGS